MRELIDIQVLEANKLALEANINSFKKHLGETNVEIRKRKYQLKKNLTAGGWKIIKTSIYDFHMDVYGYDRDILVHPDIDITKFEKLHLCIDSGYSKTPNKVFIRYLNTELANPSEEVIIFDKWITGIDKDKVIIL